MLAMLASAGSPYRQRRLQQHPVFLAQLRLGAEASPAAWRASSASAGASAAVRCNLADFMLVGKTDAEQLTLRLTEEAVQVKRYVTALN